MIDEKQHEEVKNKHNLSDEEHEEIKRLISLSPFELREEFPECVKCNKSHRVTSACVSEDAIADNQLKINLIRLNVLKYMQERSEKREG